MAGSEAPPFWYERAGWQARLLSPASLLYGSVARWRLDHARSRTVNVPVVCVGNLTVGGTGKTPTAMALADAAKQKGYRPGFLTRGYGGSQTVPHMVDLDHDTSRSVGDEPLLLAQHCPTVVARSRPAGASMLIEQGVDFLVMDDGFQSRALHFDHGLLTVDARRGIGNGHVIPAGPLRAPLKDQLRLADLLIVVGHGDGADAVIRAASRAGRPIMRATLEPVDVPDFGGSPLFGYAGIGDPEKFFDTLRRLGKEIADTRAFGDHHVYTEEDAEGLLNRANSDNLQLVTTQKDYVRLSHREGPLAELKRRTKVLNVALAFETAADAGKIIDRTIAAFEKRRFGNQ